MPASTRFFASLKISTRLLLGFGLILACLLAVAARRQGIGQQLVEAARQKAHHWGCPTLQVVTQRDNEPACRFYAQCGFELVREEHIYHLWL